MPRSGKIRPRDVEKAKDIQALSRAIREVLFEASRNYPVDGPDYLKKEWVEVTNRMICELVKRRTVEPRKMRRRARERTAELIEHRRFEELLEVEFPPLGTPTTKQDHVESKEHDEHAHGNTDPPPPQEPPPEPKPEQHKEEPS